MKTKKSNPEGKFNNKSITFVAKLPMVWFINNTESDAVEGIVIADPLTGLFHWSASAGKGYVRYSGPPKNTRDEAIDEILFFHKKGITTNDLADHGVKLNNLEKPKSCNSEPSSLKK